jgi:Family of unknown function (DUF6433)
MAFQFKMDSTAKLLAKISEIKKKEDRIEALKQNSNYTLRSILQGMFDPNVKFPLPEGKPPFNPNQFDEPKALHNEVSRFYLLAEQGNPNLTKIRREQIFIQMLEAVSPDDAELLINMKDKKCPYKGINKEVVMAAFPGLISE